MSVETKALREAIQHTLLVLKMMKGNESKQRIFVLIQTLRVFLTGALDG